MAGPGAKWAELWWQPKSFVNLLMTRRDFRFGGGALLAVLRFVYGRVQKRIAVVSRVTWTSGKRSPDDFTFIGMTFGISGGSGPPQPQAELDPREVFEMSVSVGGRVLSSQMFGALSLGDVLEYHIYDDGFNYAFKLLHLPQSALDEDRSDLATVDPSSPSPLDLQSPADVLCAEADAESLEATDSSGGAAALDNGPPAGHRRRSDASDSSAAASLRSLAPLPSANAYVLRGAFRWAPEEFPVVLTLTEDDPVHCSLPDLEYDFFAVHHLASKGCPF